MGERHTESGVERLAQLLKEAIESPELNFPEFTYGNTARWLLARGVSVALFSEAEDGSLVARGEQHRRDGGDSPSTRTPLGREAPDAPSLGETALRWQQIVDEFCEFNKYADRVIMHNFAGWLASRGAVGAGPAGAASPEKQQLRELAQAAFEYLNAEAHVGVTEETMRRLNHRLGSLAGPHLVAMMERASAPQDGTP